jgi:hypothetical protein
MIESRRNVVESLKEELAEFPISFYWQTKENYSLVERYLLREYALVFE